MGWDANETDRNGWRLVCLTLGKGAPDRVERGAGVAVHADENLARADGGGRDERTIEHEVWRTGQEQLVLRARWLALGAVHDDDRPAGSRGDRFHLAGRREPTAALAPQAGAAHGV